MAKRDGRLIKNDAETCIKAIRQWCDEREDLAQERPDHEEAYVQAGMVVGGEQGNIADFLDLCRSHGLVATSRQVRDIAYKLQAEGQLSTSETRILTQTWCPDIVLHISNNDDYYKVMISTMVEIMCDMRRTALFAGTAKQKASAAKALNGICRDLVVMEERRRIAVEQTVEVEANPDKILEEKEQRLLEDKRASEERRRRLEEARRRKEEMSRSDHDDEEF